MTYLPLRRGTAGILGTLASGCDHSAPQTLIITATADEPAPALPADIFQMPNSAGANNTDATRLSSSPAAVGCPGL